MKTLTRAKFESLAHGLIQACLEPCKKAMSDAGSVSYTHLVGVKPLIQGVLLWVVISLSTLAYIYFV